MERLQGHCRTSRHESLTARGGGGEGNSTHHDEVPHARRFRHQRGDAAAAGHQHDFDGLRVEEVIEQLGGLSWVTLAKTKRETLKKKREMDA